MHTKDYTLTIPAQVKGNSFEAESVRVLPTVSQADMIYRIAKRRLLYVEDWHALAGATSALFTLTDAHGNVMSHPAAKGNFIRIDIPGPVPHAGNGFDWVFIEELEEISSNSVSCISMRVRPCADPTRPDENVAHFFNNDAANNFVVTRDQKQVSCAIVDGNMQAYNNTSSVVDNIRNTVVVLNEKAGLSTIQWQVLADALIATVDL